MKLFYLPALQVNSSATDFTLTGKGLIFLVFVLLLAGIQPPLKAQQISIGQRSNLVLNGNVSLVINNASFQNNGNFAAGASTVSFTGHLDTTTANVSGSESTSFNNLSIAKTAYGLALKSAVIVENVLAVTAGNLYTDSNLTLRSDVNLTARVDVVPASSKIIGKANVERYVPARRSWRLMTAPVTNSNSIYDSWQNGGVYAPGVGMLVTGPNPSETNGLDVSVQNTVSIKGWNHSTQQFVNVVNTKTAVFSGNTGSADNLGFFVFVRGDRDPVNTNPNYKNVTTLTSTGALQTGTQTFAASPVLNKFTLVGNPYASPVDFNSVTRTNLVKRFYVWDPSLNSVGGYVMLDDLDGDNVFQKSIAGSAQTKDIQSSQAFFVQTNATAAIASIAFNESSKSGNNNNQVFRPVTATPTGVGNGQVITTLNLLNSDNTITLADGALAEFNHLYSAAVDLDDAMKFGNTNENLSIIRNNVSLTAERRPAATANDTLYFRLATTTQRDYQFVFEVSGLEQPGMMGFLEDSYTGTSTFINLAGTTIANFSINAQAASAAINRFKIVFKPISAPLPVTISNVKAYQKANQIAVEWKVENELNMLQYEVEKSTNGTVFTPVSTIKVNGVNNAYNSYSWLDLTAVQENNFYRIKSYDNNGKVKYSSIVKVTIGKGAGGFSIYPNPVTGSMINLVMMNQPAGEYQVKLTNIAGQSIFVKSVESNGGNSTESLNTGSKLPAGIYRLEIISRDHLHNTQKVIVE
ncbi:MAG: type sorting protein [Ferruginibacter sp.]|nr:type sorting protein [Ferruginibacter sp.]